MFCAMAPGATAWRFYVDLDRGEWQAWGGAWQPLGGQARICSPGEYPEPDASWSPDQLRGLRTVRDPDGTVCGRSGPGRAEDLATWQAWLQRVNEFAARLEVPA